MLIAKYIKLDTVALFDTALVYAAETRAQLEMKRSSADDRDKYFYHIYGINIQMGMISKRMMRYELALNYMQEALAAARLVGHEVDGKQLSLSDALTHVAEICGLLKNREGIKYAEEVYILLSGQLGPEHLDVQSKATLLIDSYMEMENFVDAERFARITYECLIDPRNKVDQKSERFAHGIMQVARVWIGTPPDQRIGGPEAAEEAEAIARKACEIFNDIERDEGFDGRISTILSASHIILASVMMERDKFTSETEKMIRRALSYTKDLRVGAIPRMESSYNRHRYLSLLANLYHLQGLTVAPGTYDVKSLEKSRYVYEELVIIGKALFSSDDPCLLSHLEEMREIDELLASCELK
jgi:hypothetical protein